MQALLNARVLTERGLETGLAVRLQGDTILDVVRAEPSALGNCESIDLGGQVLAPGFIDLQVNGGGDVLFNDAPNVATLRRIASAHRRFGTTSMLPTLISSEREVLRVGIGAVRETIAAKIAGVLGIHIEGPFIAAARKGVHDPRMFRGIDATDIELMAAPGHGRTLVTLAPERVEPTLVAQLCQRGIIVAAGHTDASYEITRTALDAGMSGFTHLFNAMSPLQGRAPGVVGAALEDRSSWCGVIVDGQHVHPVALRIALSAKPRGKVVLVTDAMPPVGGGRVDFQLDGRVITCRDGRCTTADGVLAGSCLDMATAVRNTVRLLAVPLDEALRMASTYPANVLGLERSHGRIAAGYRADLVALDAALMVRSVWCGGIRELHATTQSRID
ncbi:N-acetylglucosamine-6-phosphate deacetylase [Metallibacterium sp.]|uniref:N-acetylglucosamine-6-phosphate deacetylase n=1 Tax=Metallibacterium sp. TaxID=2940281 RepID=UPI0026235F7E|nr:N-acetylglucosamine-6-phosphate deacetylase [Metallibacterium sp.]